MSNTPPLKRLQVGLAILAVIFVVAVCGYRLGGWSLMDSIYMTVTTLSMVGYRDDIGATGMTPELKVFTTVLIVGVRHPGGGLVFNPGADTVFQAGDTVIVLGQRDDIERFRADHGI